MKTIVYQSYRTHDVAAWMTRCMASVRTWSEARRYEYRFIDDSLFDYVPGWYRTGSGGNVQIVSNLARLLVAKELLAAGYDRTIWIDADILVFDQEGFHIDVASEFAFCHEVWITTRWGSLIKQVGVNNSVCVFVRGNAFLDFCIWAHEDLVRRGTQLQAHGTSTRLLTALDRATPLPQLNNVGVLSPVVAHELRNGRNRIAKQYAAMHGAPIQAMNLGGSLCGRAFEGRVLGNDDYEAIVDAVGRAHGAIFRDEFAA